MQKQFVGLWSYSIYPSSANDIKFIQIKDKHFQKVLNAALRLVYNVHSYLSPYRFGIDGMGIWGIYRAIYSNEIKFVCYNSSIRTPQLMVPSVYLSIKVTFHTFIQTNPFPTKLLRESKTHIRI